MVGHMPGMMLSRLRITTTSLMIIPAIRVPAGVYFIKLETPDSEVMQKVILLK